MIKSLYIHIPFCKDICSYCDFCKMFYNEELVDKYLIRLKKEIDSYNIDQTLKTIYIGGGTPSCLSIDQLNKLFNITNSFSLDKSYEFTFECNISDLDEDKLKLLKDNRVNRISIGIQTINKKFYKTLNRYNNKDTIRNKIELCKKYFDNINIDLMYGFNNETMKDLDKDLDFFLSLDIPHISIYSLIIEKNTMLFLRNYLQIDDEIESNMYYHIIDVLKKNNYNHYEISNFSRDGYESIHNLNYWDNNEYYGVGLGASGYVNNIRYSNTRGINKYLTGNFKYMEEEMTENLKMENEMMLGLRKIKGVNKNKFFEKYKCNIEDKFDIIKLIKNNMLEDDGENIFIKEDKMYVSNSILVNFIGGTNE